MPQDSTPDSERFSIPKRGEYDFKKVSFDDPRVWSLFCRGDTLGVFQLEKSLGQEWSRKVKPTNIQELSALIAILRPGAMETGMAEAYAKRKNGLEEVEPFKPALEPILRDTYQTLIYQEQVLSICSNIAGFTEVESDLMRRAIGKKKADEMIALQQRFVDGCVRVGKVTKEDAEEIFGWIEKSNRYLFNACLSPNTMVETESGYIALKDVAIGSCVRTLDEEGHETFVKVLNKFNNGLKKVWRLDLGNANAIDCTLDHKFLCEDGKIRRLIDILPGVGSTGQKPFVFCGRVFDVEPGTQWKRHDNIRILTRSGPSSVVSITYVGSRSTMDIEVDDPRHLFLANGIMTSNSHSVSYAINAYYSAYQKAHFPTEFYTAWLTYSDWKPNPKEEIYNLVQNARDNNITVKPPDIRLKNTDFTITGNREITFGLSHIRGVGTASIDAIKRYDLSTFTNLIKYTKKIRRNVAESLIKSGACDCYGMDRITMLRHIYAIFGRTEGKDAVNKAPETSPMTDKEFAHFVEVIDTAGIVGAIESVAVTKACVKRRIPSMDAKIKYLLEAANDTNRQKSVWEKIYLGLNLTCSAADDYTKDKDVTTCHDVYTNIKNKKVKLQVVIDGIRMKKTGERAKNPGQDYCYLSVSDGGGSLSNLICWPEVYAKNVDSILLNSVVTLKAHKDDWNGKHQLVVDEIQLIG